MLTLQGTGRQIDCEGTSRRDFLKIGSLGMSGLTLPALLQARSEAAVSGRPVKDTSVVWLWLGGGPTQVETFDPKMDAPVEYRSVVGAVDSAIPGVQLGGRFPQMAQMAKRMAFVRSFAHGNSGHSGGTHFVMTGVNHTLADAGQAPIRPSIGSVVAKSRGTHHPVTGMPTYVRFNRMYGDGPDWLGMAHSPFDTGGQARNNMNPVVDVKRIGDRRSLLKSLDRVDQSIDRRGMMGGMSSFESQAYGMILGRSKEAFDLNREDPRTRDKYRATGHALGERLLLARRLCEAGAGFITMHYSNSYQGWDMHSKIEQQVNKACPPLDMAVATFLDDLAQRGMSEKILLVITGEFGRTPRINANAGRDHWGPLCTLALAGGGLNMGQVVGESTAKAEIPKTTPIRPKDLMATIFHVLGIDQTMQVVDPSGRPSYLLPEGAKPIAELV